MEEMPHLLKWYNGLVAYHQLLTQYIREIDGVAQKSRPLTRIAFTTFQTEAEKILKGVLPLDENFFITLHLLENVRKALVNAANAALDPKLRAEVEQRRSHTYIDELKKQAYNLEQNQSKLIKDGFNAASEMALKYDLTQPIEALATKYKLSKNSICLPAAALYAELLEKYAINGTDVVQYVKQAQNDALDIVSDDAKIIKTAVSNRIKYHPIQALGFTFSGVPQKSLTKIPTTAALIVNMTLPQATKSVSYNLQALIDPKIQYGAALSGINFKLVDKLDTIKSVDVLNKYEQYTFKNPTGSMVRTTDNGRTFVEMAYPHLVKHTIDYFAGPQLCVNALNKLEQSELNLIPDREHLLKRFEEIKVDLINSATVRNTLQNEKYDQCVCTLLTPLMEKTKQQIEFASVGGPTLPGVEHAAPLEILLSTILQANNLSLSLQKRIRTATSKRLEAIFTDANPIEINPSLKLFALKFRV
jgi:hypothetical protein